MRNYLDSCEHVDLMSNKNRVESHRSCHRARRADYVRCRIVPHQRRQGRQADDFGALVTILPGKDGLVHVSQISNERVEKVSDKLKEGGIVKAKVLEVDKQGRIRLSMKAVEVGEEVTP